MCGVHKILLLSHVNDRVESSDELCVFFQIKLLITFRLPVMQKGFSQADSVHGFTMSIPILVLDGVFCKNENF